MPIDFEMILSASPPLFSSTAFVDFRYGTFHSDHSRHNRFDSAFNDYPRNGDVHSDLMAKSEEEQKECSKKRVWFADDKGLALTHVKIMSEPSNCPPRWTDEFLAQVTKGIKPNPMSDIQWVPQFAQPASDYMEFRDKLQQKCVSLENVIVKEGDDLITGTIKVKNIAFDKEVFVRVSFDKWSSSQDIPATFVPSGVETCTSQYDTFSFSISVPPSAAKYEMIEFCVGFRCSDVEFWDNNSGKNYKLAALNRKSQIAPVFSKQCNDALQVSLDSWSEFASWSHLITEGPYCHRSSSKLPRERMSFFIYQWHFSPFEDVPRIEDISLKDIEVCLEFLPTVFTSKHARRLLRWNHDVSDICGIGSKYCMLGDI